MKRHKTPLHNRGRIKFDPQIQIGTKIYVQNLLVPSNDILNRFCLTRGSTLTSQDYSPSSVVYEPEPIRAGI